MKQKKHKLKFWEGKTENKKPKNKKTTNPKNFILIWIA